MSDQGYRMRDQGSRIRGFRIRRFWIQTVTAVVAFAALATAGTKAQSSVAADRLWFSPSPGAIDYVRLFDDPDQWPRARQVLSVFKFYQQHTQTPAPSIVGPNSYDALA